jgi:hypothetical protein
VQYLYVHRFGDAFAYPSSRVNGNAQSLAARYLECALVQATSVAMHEPRWRNALVMNTFDETVLGPHAAAILRRLEELGVELVQAPYRHEPVVRINDFFASRYVLDAIEAMCIGRDRDEEFFFVDCDCVWLDPQRVRAAAPADGVGLIRIAYPDDWDLYGHTPASLAKLGATLGEMWPEPSWAGGELIAGRSQDVLALVAACDATERELAELGVHLTTEEQALTLVARLGRVPMVDMSHVAWRIWTGPRHGAPPVDPHKLGLWHLPAEKGLSLRRTARQLERGNTEPLRRDLALSSRAATRFNVGPQPRRRRIRDDSWIVGRKLRDALARRGS